MKLEKRKVSQLSEWERNPRAIDKKDFERLKRQITKLGIYKPLLINQDGIVLGGNMRLKAFQDTNVDEVMCSIVETKNETEMVEYALSDNDRMGYYEDQALAELVASVPDIDLGDFKVDLGKPIDLEQLLQQFGPEPVEDEAPEVSDEEPESKPGEVYQLGRHRLMCGDSTKIEDVERLMDGKKADMVFTDPPYNIDYEGKTKQRLKIKNDKFEGDGFYQFLLDAFVNLYVSTKPGTAIYVCHADMERINFQMAMSNSGYTQKQNIIWAKDSMVLGRQDYHWQHEPILYGWKEDNGKHKWDGDRTQTALWSIKRPTRSEEHPTMKPLALMDKAMRNSTKTGEIVLDTFLGSGSTLMACEQADRVCYGMELDPHYCDVKRKRYAKFIGKEDEWQTLTPAIKS